VRARFLHGGIDHRLLRGCGASCFLSLLAVGPPVPRPPGALSRGFGGASEWPAGGLAVAVAADPGFANRRALASQARYFGVKQLHSTLLPEARGTAVPGAEGSRGMRLSHTQSRNWADRRVREGVSRARAGDQKGAMERYAAALELCPRHKEGLVGRGAALVNVGRPREALKDFDAALRLDPDDANATKYREIARRRLRDEGVGTAGSEGDERSKRRRGVAVSVR